MKKLSIYITGLIISMMAFAQLEITIYGDPNDSTIIRRKQAMEEKGFSVKVKAEESEEPSGDVEFINKWTNKPFPSFELTDLNGNKIQDEDLTGKIVHINFWSITCKPCIEEFAELNDLKEKYKDQVYFLAIAPESEAKVKKVLKRHTLEYQTVASAADLFDEMEIDGYPKNLFISKHGTIEKIIDGTHYTLEFDKKKPKMVPDNFKYYDEILAKMTESRK